LTVETVARTIQLILAPVVMVSACAILLTGLLSRYAAINDRLRLMGRERFDLIAALKEDTASYRSILHGERLSQIDYQIPLLMRRHKMAHDSVLAIYCSTGIFVADMFIIALGAVSYADWIGIGVLLVFVLGTLALLGGVLITAWEVRISHRAVHYEVERILKMQI
jgi:hypothetical protein